MLVATCIHTYVQVTQTVIRIYIHTNMHAHTCICARAHTRICMYTCIHMHTIHTHAHTHIQDVYVRGYCVSY